MAKHRRRSAASYHEAMLLCPQARRLEFLYPLELASPKGNEVLVDFPSAGGYLEPWLHSIAPDATYHAVEHISGYENRETDIRYGDWEILPFNNGTVDIIMVIAALHHVFPDRNSFYGECHRVLGTGGRMIIADVAEGTAAGRFLEEFVTQYSSEGHEARFFNEAIDKPEIESSGFSVSHYHVKKFFWLYPNSETAIRFCRGLFSTRYRHG